MIPVEPIIAQVEVDIIWLMDNPMLAAVLVIAYLQYSMKFGALGAHLSQIESLTKVVIAIAHIDDDIDEEAVMNELDATDSRIFQTIRDKV